ncbi:hypothetical protein OK351_05715 [Glutamicibacter sp. MNS18]|uniref:hypothetical protein n=1 Tax=Glutamicibacter sp. MNS18 TaxID=2989817 RepID=UPI0022369E62|nr:hypothetical protein [Glutamicibacter sp. MNS18]MCW4464999.1 hypothetical protein [Glutamicibacter sp. MNS18]
MSSLLAGAQLATRLVGGHRMDETAGWSTQPKADRANPIRARRLVGLARSDAAG